MRVVKHKMFILKVLVVKCVFMYSFIIIIIVIVDVVYVLGKRRALTCLSFRSFYCTNV